MAKEIQQTRHIGSPIPFLKKTKMERRPISMGSHLGGGCIWQGQVQGSLHCRYPKQEVSEDRVFTGSAQGKGGSGPSKTSGKKVSLHSYSLSQRELESSKPCEAGPVVTQSAVSRIDGNPEICPSLRAPWLARDKR